MSHRYADASGTSITVDGLRNAACLTYAADGVEEMHVFFAIAWFDAGSWAWAHYFHEWASKGVFMVGILGVYLCFFLSFVVIV